MELANGKQQRPRAHVLMVAADGQGHYYPFLQILYHLSTPRYVDRVTVTFVNSERGLVNFAARKENSDFGSLDLRFQALTASAPVQVGSHRPGPEDFANNVMREFEPLKQKFLSDKGNADGPTCIMGDMFFSWLLDLAEDLNIPWYPIYPASSWYTYSCLVGSNPIWQSTDPEVRKQTAPGLNFCRIFDYPQDILWFSEFFSKKQERLEKSATVVINVPEEWDVPTGCLALTRELLESKAIAENRPVPKVVAVGPMVNIEGMTLTASSKKAETKRAQCFTWLDQQPPKSVLYIAFGTITNLEPEDMVELAHGLEDSGVSFLWVIKVPANESLESVLPPGFEERIKGRAVMDTSFVPQSQILLHPAIAGFMSHCGWNSSMESICAGVPLLTYPLSLDQPANARFVVNVWKAGIGLKKADEDYYTSRITREEVTEAINTLMIGSVAEEVRSNVQMLQSLAKAALGEGGSSHKALHSFLEEITSPAQKDSHSLHP
ncbi:hypothetical protein Mapa_013713 [Marchantia paleacea]|nr:hypothetical protein Mapa_013713 [Marchantia paleacea]